MHIKFINMHYCKGKFKFTDEEFLAAVEAKKSIKEMMELFKVGKGSIIKRLRKFNIRLYNYHNEDKFDSSIFDSIDTEEKAYWLGFIYADGYISFQQGKYTLEISLKGEDVGHLYKFNSFMKYKGDNVKLGNSSCNGKHFTRCRWAITNKHLWNTLNNYGCVPKKSLILKFPEEEIFKDKSLIRHFLRGYFDGDGCLSINKKDQISCSVLGTKEFLEKYLNYCPDTEEIQIRKSKSKVYIFAYSTKRAVDFAEFLYSDSNVYLDRKYNRYRFAVLQRNL